MFLPGLTIPCSLFYTKHYPFFADFCAFLGFSVLAFEFSQDLTGVWCGIFLFLSTGHNLLLF